MNPFEACDDSLVDAMRTMAEWQEAAEVFDERVGLFVRGKSRFPTPYSNAGFPVDPTITGEALIARAQALFADRRHILWARGEDGGEPGRYAIARGFVSLGALPAMVIDVPVAPRDTPGVEVRAVTDATGFADFLRIAQLAYAELGLPDAIAASLLARPQAAIDSSVIAVARIAGEPVAGALAITNGITGVGGVYWVGTTPAARRRGAADAVTRFVTNAAFHQGASIVTLQASSEGEPVYLRMGYREVGRYARFLSPPRTDPSRP